MELNTSAPEVASPLSNSSGSPSSSSSSSSSRSSYDSAIRNSLLMAHTSSEINSNVNIGGVDFVSGVQVFETETERPETPEKPIFDPEEFPPLKRVEPVTKVSPHEDDDEKISKPSEFGEGSVGVDEGKGLVEGLAEKNGVEEGFVVKLSEKVEGSPLDREKTEVYSGNDVEESEILGNGNEKIDTVELGKDDMEKTDTVNFSSEGDKVVEAVPIETLDTELEKTDSGNLTSEGDKVVEAAPIEKLDTVALGKGKDDMEKTDSLNFTSEGDKVVEALPVSLVGSGVVVIGDEEIKDSGPIEKEALIDGVVPLDTGSVFSKISNDVEKTTNLDAEYEEFLEAVNGPEKTLPVADCNGGKHDGLGDGGDGDVSQTVLTSVTDAIEDEVSGDIAVTRAISSMVLEVEDENEENNLLGGEDENEGSLSDGEDGSLLFGNSEAAKQFLEELQLASTVDSQSGAQVSNDYSERIDGQIVTDSDEDDTDEEGEGRQLFDSAALAALLKAATGGGGSEGGTVTLTSQDGSRLFSVERPAGLGSGLRPVKPAARAARPSLFGSSNLTAGGESDKILSEEDKLKLEKLQQLRVKFLRLVHRLGQSPEESMVTQVLYRLALVAGRQTSQLFSLDAAKRTALELEEQGKDDMDFSLNILVLGKTGVGKSATINSIFGEEKSPIHAFEPATNSVREITGMVDGIKIRVIDCPGLKSSGSEQGLNRRILSSVKKFMKKCPPDIVLYVDRLDTRTRDLNDLPLLKSISSNLGSSIWRNAVVTLTHAASAPPDGPSGSPLSYEVFVAQRSHVVQQSIGQAVGDLRLMNPSLMNPVSLVENHPSCRKNREGQKVLPNGQTWRPQLLLLSYSMKILAEASSISKPQDPFDHRKLFGLRSRSPPLPYLLSWLLQSRAHPKLSTDQGGDTVDSDVDLADLSDSDNEDEEDEYDQLPPFKPLRKAQLAKLSKEQKEAYFTEYDYRVKLLQKKQWREELKRMREMKKKGKVTADEYAYNGEDDPENGGPAAVPVPLPDMALPPSFDGDNPAYRYRFLEPTSQFLARPVLDTHGWDHDCGYDGVNLEHTLAVVNQFPAAVAVQLTKDKKEFSVHLDSSVAAKHGENASSMVGFDIQNVGKQLAYVLRGETKFKNFRMNKTAAGMSVTFLGQNVATGFKLEDQIGLGKRLTLVGSTGTVRSQGDSAYGANLEVRLKEADYPIGQDQSSLGLSLVKWRGDLALGANLQSQISLGRSYKVAVRAGLNNKMSGQITVRTSSSEQFQIALMGLLPIAMSIYKSLRPGVSENNYSLY